MQIIPPEQNSSFIVQTITSEQFNTCMQQHAEYELILFTKGSGIAVIGDHEGKFNAGDIYFLGSNLSHSFQTFGNDLATGVMINFRETCWGDYFMNLPECTEIRKLFEIAAYGLQLTGTSKHHLQPIIKALEKVTGMNRIIFLLHCLQTMSSEKNYVMLSKIKMQTLSDSNKPCIDKVLEFTLASFREPISLSHAASLAFMSIPSFCHYFKQQTSKTYINYLAEVRVNYACRQLLETNKPVADIGFESGYNTIVHFHRQFFKKKKITPLQYRKKYSTQRWVYHTNQPHNHGMPFMM